MNSTVIRPDLMALRRMPTIHKVAEPWGKLELKLETPDTRYWLTTEGVSRKTTGTPINYVVDYVTVEKRGDDGSWDLKAVYSPRPGSCRKGSIIANPPPGAGQSQSAVGDRVQLGTRPGDRSGRDGAGVDQPGRVPVVRESAAVVDLGFERP